MRVNRQVVQLLLDSDMPLKGAIERGVGRSTAQALRLIAMAIDRPGTRVIATDHHGSLRANENMVHRCADMVTALNLRGFTFNAASSTMQCDFSEEI